MLRKLNENNNLKKKKNTGATSVITRWSDFLKSVFLAGIILIQTF